MSVATAPGCAVETVTEPSRFLALEREWNDAVDRAGLPHPFLRHEWVRTWWEAFGGRAQLHVLVARAGGRIVAIAPLLREATQMYGLPVRRLRFLANDHTPRTDLIVTPGGDAGITAIWDALARSRPQWDLLQLIQLPADSPTRARLTTAAEAAGCTTGVWTSGRSPFLELTGTWDSYLGSLPAKFRSNLRNRLSRLARIGEPKLEVLRDADAIASACDEAWRLEASGWKRQAGTAITSDAAVQRFYTTLVPRAAAAGWLRLMFLTVGGRRIATSYGAVYDGRLFLFKTGYDPEFATGAPFKILTSLAIQHAYAEGLRELDFLGDDEPWKLEWTSTTRGHDWLFVFSDSVRARLLRSIKFHWVPELKRWRA